MELESKIRTPRCFPLGSHGPENQDSLGGAAQGPDPLAQQSEAECLQCAIGVCFSISNWRKQVVMTTGDGIYFASKMKAERPKQDRTHLPRHR